MQLFELCLFTVGTILFVLLCLFAPILMSKALDSSLMFKAKDAYDIEYDKNTEILKFKTKSKYDDEEIEWMFKGSCTVWYWRKYYSGRCSTLYEYELSEIWNKII